MSKHNACVMCGDAIDLKRDDWYEPYEGGRDKVCLPCVDIRFGRADGKTLDRESVRAVRAGVLTNSQ